MSIQTSRRTLLKGAAASSIALVIGMRANGTFAAAPTVAHLNPFVSISDDGVVHVIIKHFEMGQGTTTGLATLVAEELDADWNRVAVHFAPADKEKYKNLFFGAQGTGGSTAMANSYMQYRQAAAAARAVLVQAAAEMWNVPASQITISGSVLKAGDKRADFGEAAVKASGLTAPENPVIKDPSEFRLIGLDRLPRKDSHLKTTGLATFAMDVKVPGMVYAVLIRSPRFGGKLVSFDASGAESIPGFVGAKALPTGAAIAVYGKNTWAAIQARDAITADWDFSAAENRSTDELTAYHHSLLDTPQFEAVEGADRSATEAAVAAADQVIETELTFPFLAHAPMEPLNCVIEPTETGIRVHDGCQFPGAVKPTLAHVLEMDPEQIEIRTVYAGGSFGRRATTNADYQVEAAMAFAMLGRKTPVKLVWTREDDIKGGYYRPMFAHRVRVGLKGGKISAWDHRVAGKPIIKGTPFESLAMPPGSQVDATSVEGVNDSHYAIPAMSVGLSDAETQVPVLWWRSVGHTHTAFAMETTIDQVAEALGKDPVAYRLELLSDGGKDQERLAGVLKLAAEKAGWGNPSPGRHQGIAVHKSFNTYVAEVVEVSVNEGAVKIEKVVCAVDCGTAVNPDVIRAQMEGGIGYGLGHVIRNRITLTEGEVDQFNFPDYEPLRINEMPVVEVHIVASAEAPTGVGEPGVPPVGPALANAIYAATGTRVSRLPMTESGVSFA
ncbi:molybdopterin cofactor-binding domain-containing protein [Hwanghaeella sp.]|uniref:xanthine dehydrogenase family protein molybdopterin-binding subunit n=1 Tax=Hwanghaeella sp. TaxID=2605943 RepID=UPI003CCBE363